ncbi:hypothetical protein SRHO_G00333790 [Serrasalmus rhombeus]
MYVWQDRAVKAEFGGEQKYVKLSKLSFHAFLKEVLLKFNIPKGRQPDIKVYDQSDTEVDLEVFEEIAKESPGIFRVTLCSEEPDGGPGHVRQPFTSHDVPTDEDMEAAIAVLRYSADEDTVRAKMKTTFIYRQAMVNDADKSADVFSVFPRFLDTPGLIEQDFRLMFGEVTSNKFLERWPTTFKRKVMEESHGLVPTTELLDLMRNAESAVEVENGWDSAATSAQGRKRPGKMSASQAVDQLMRFQKVGTSVQQHLDSITQSSKPYLLVLGSTKSSIHSYFVVIDKHALPCKATGSVGDFDELFKAHFVFGTSYSSCLNNIFTFVQTTIYNIDSCRVKNKNGALVKNC